MSKFFTTELSNAENEFDHLRWITVKSKALKRRADISVYIPPLPGPGQSLDVVILLHGVYGSHWAWAMNGSVHKTAHRLIDQGRIRPTVLVMPSDGLHGDGSGYLTHQDVDFEAWIVDDVITVVKEQITGVDTRSNFFITGLSMGGYGALRLGAKYSHVFRSFSGLSSITEFSQLALFLEADEFKNLSHDVVKKETVLECLLEHKKDLPHFHFDCGTNDLLIEFNRELHQNLLEHNIAHTYVEHAGAHEWKYWATHIEDSLLFFNGFNSGS